MMVFSLLLGHMRGWEVSRMCFIRFSNPVSNYGPFLLIVANEENETLHLANFHVTHIWQCKLFLCLEVARLVLDPSLGGEALSHPMPGSCIAEEEAPCVLCP